MLSHSQNKIFWNPRGFIKVTVVGLQSPATIEAMGDKILEMTKDLHTKHQPVLILDDLTKMNPKQPTEVGQAVAAQAKRIKFDRVAMLGSANRLLMYGTNFIIKAVGKTQSMKYFRDRGEAEKWLLEKLRGDSRSHI